MTGMEITIITPTETRTLDGVEALYAEGLEGHFAMLPRHADYVAAIVPSIFSARGRWGEKYFGVDDGVLVKAGHVVRMAARRSIEGGSLDELGARVLREFKEIDEADRREPSALASLEGSIARLILGLKG